MNLFHHHRYLKRVGSKIDVKVSLGIVNSKPVIWIRDHEFFDYRAAMSYLRHIAETEIAPEKSDICEN